MRDITNIVTIDLPKMIEKKKNLMLLKVSKEATMQEQLQVSTTLLVNRRSF